MTMRAAVAGLAALLMLAGCTSSDEDSAGDRDQSGQDDAPQVGSEHPLYAGWARITPADYQGLIWHPLPRYTDGEATKTYLKLRSDGRWIGSDGCNVQSGRYRLWPNGDLAALPDGQTLIACPGVNINAALDGSDRIDVDGRRLTLYNGTNVVLVLTTPGWLACCPLPPKSDPLPHGGGH
ncbi:MAG TPA: META domain-containing protein [Nocardioidaceae bacterium]|nr:META domain-containing protein [Nocardioidaceae bacterium]